MGGNEWMIFISLCPLCYCCFDAVYSRRRGKHRLYSLPWGCNPSSMQGREGKKIRGTEWKVWYSKTKVLSQSRKKLWQMGLGNRQTEGKEMGCSVTWRRGVSTVVAGRGTTATGVTHFFLLFIPVAVFYALCFECVFVAFNNICWIQIITTSVCSVFKVCLSWDLKHWKVHKWVYLHLFYHSDYFSTVCLFLSQ